METKRELISKLLAEWNPLSVPVEIADTEYEDYVLCTIGIDKTKSKGKAHLLALNSRKQWGR